MKWNNCKYWSRFLLFVSVSSLFGGTALFAQLPSTDQLLRFKPATDAIIDNPSEEEIAGCQVEVYKNTDGTGYSLIKSDGTLLRQMLDTDANKKIDSYRYFRDGSEVYRENIVGEETKPNQCRWLQQGGTRWGILENGAIVQWRTISAEETTAEIVAALANQDVARFMRVAVTSDELKGLGISDAALLDRAANAQADFTAAIQNLKIPKNAEWTSFSGGRPAVIPQGRFGLTDDLNIYANATVVLHVRSTDAQTPPQNAQFTVSDLIKIGNTWKILGIPSGNPFGTNTENETVSASAFLQGGMSGAAGQQSENTAEQDQLMQVYEELNAATAPAQIEKLYDQIVSLLLTIAGKTPQERGTYIKEAAEQIYTAIQTGNYPNGLAKLDELYQIVKDDQDQELVAFVRLRQIAGEYYSSNAQAGINARRADIEKIQEKYTSDLTVFIEEFPRTASGAEAMMQLANDAEFNQDNEQAVNLYTQIVTNFPDNALGQKAKGALRRIQAVGNQLALPKWNMIDKSQLDIADYRGKPTVLYFWATWSAGDELNEMKSLLTEYKGTFNVVGINLDENTQELAAFLKTNPPAWKTVFEQGGLNSAPAVYLGIQNTPTFILLDGEGNVQNPNISTVSDLKIELERINQ